MWLTPNYDGDKMTLLSLFDEFENDEVTFTHDPIAVALLRSEGREVLVPYLGAVETTVRDLLGGGVYE